MGVAVTRKPTSTPCDHVKHPERLGVQWHDAGEAMAAMVAEEVVSVEWASRAMRSGGAAGILRIFIQPKGGRAHACFSYLVIFLKVFDDGTTSDGQHLHFRWSFRACCSLFASPTFSQPSRRFS